MSDQNEFNRGRGRQRQGGWNPGQRQRGPDWGGYNQIGREWQQGPSDEWQEQVEDTYDMEGDDPLGSRLMRDDIAARRGFDQRRRREEYDPQQSSGRGYREDDAPFMRSYPETRQTHSRPAGEPYFAEPRAGMSRGRTQVPAGRTQRRSVDDIPRGRFTGVGPQNYTRSDERIREDISDRLARAGDLDASGIQVSVQQGEVTLSGSVRRKQDKWQAEEIAEDVTGVKDVHNQIHSARSLGARVKDAIKDVFD